ncbi:hypothetical protein GPECTOR_22g940 [Gonium pectorale]|uniref:Ferritin n=1 Tax=Gonium pectorale TaxID=33097 RepID=A0A150GHP3_GONPE|nr:hypothetical protein GPECTOR_22g940 [Gonium pectorale]|eukprot:KXZ49346.1 hypothetical protein GPECTOR_22g940 [Gonium pectorale]
MAAITLAAGRSTLRPASTEPSRPLAPHRLRLRRSGCRQRPPSAFREDRGRGEEPGADPVIERAKEQTRGSAPAPPQEAQTQTGLVFQPMGEVAPLVAALDRQLLDPAREPGLAATQSLARMGFGADLEAGINEQINIELNMSYVYTSMYNFFARDDVGLPGFAAYFAHSADDERSHSRMLMDYQTQRGGRVKLLALAQPETEFWHQDKGDALHATELALSLEKLNFSKLRELHDLAEREGDSDATHFIEDNLLHQQSKDVKEAAVLVSQVRRAGRGLGVFHVDHLLSRQYGNQDGAGPLAG